MKRRQLLAAIPLTLIPTIPAQAATWERRADLAVGRSEMPAATLDGMIFVAGGFGAGARADRYDPVADQWQQLADLPVETNHPGIAAIQGRIIVAGGYTMDGQTAHDGMWAYRNDSDDWQVVGELPEPMGAFGLVAVGDELYLVGGALGSLNGEPSSATWRWQPEEGAWEERAPLTNAREHMATVSLCGFIYAIGGRAHGQDSDDLGSTVERYDPETDTWEKRAPLPEPRSGLNGATACNAIVVAGGETSTNVFANTQIYDPAGDTWQSLPDLPIPVHGVAIAAVETQLFAIGGSTAAGRVQNSSGVHALDLADIRITCAS